MRGILELMNEDFLMAMPSSSSCDTVDSAIHVSIADFQFSKMQSWREGTGVGVSEQVSMGRESSLSSGSAVAIDSSNIGFQLLKKHGWREGTGLGASEQGRLEPVEACMKNNKRGLGADRVKKKVCPPNHQKVRPPHTDDSEQRDESEQEQKPRKKSKALSKKIRKMQELEKQLQEKEFERAFFREFWPDNV